MCINIITVYSLVNWWLIGFLYFGICLLLWTAVFRGKKIIKVSGGIIMILVFFSGYFLSTAGILGLGLILNNWEGKEKRSLPGNRLYMETQQGNATTDFRYKKVEVYKPLPLLPFLAVRESVKIYALKWMEKELIWTEEKPDKKINAQ
jgi:hypothetical protein